MTQASPSAPFPTRSSSLAPSSRSRTQAEKRSSEPVIGDPVATSTSVNDAATQSTESFIRRTLCAHQLHAGGFGGDKASPPIDQLLPPLTSSNEVDVQLYAFIAILIRELVQPWYTKITSDHVLVDEVIQIVAHCTRALEQRLRDVDVEGLIMQDVAELFDAHVSAYRVSHAAAQDPASPLEARRIYHSLRPHPALFPVPDDNEPSTVQQQADNDAVYRHLLAQGLLAVLLPTEDLQNQCLRSLVGEVSADFLLGNFLSGRLCESDFVYDLIGKAAHTIQQRLGIQPWARDTSDQIQDRLEKHGLLPGHGPRPTRKPTLTQLFWRGAHYAWLFVIAVRTLLVAFVQASSLSSRGTAPHRKTGRPNSPTSSRSISDAVGTKTPIIDYAIWPTAARLIQLPCRMPWLYGGISLMHHLMLHGPGMVGDTNGRVDR